MDQGSTKTSPPSPEPAGSACLDGYDTIVGAAYGPLPHVVQLAGAGEVYAFLMVLRLAGPMGVEAVTDCRMVEDIWRFGPWQDLEKVAFSELRQEIFKLSEEIGRESISMRRIGSVYRAITKILGGKQLRNPRPAVAPAASAARATVGPPSAEMGPCAASREILARCCPVPRRAKGVLG